MIAKSQNLFDQNSYYYNLEMKLSEARALLLLLLLLHFNRKPNVYRT